MLRRSLASLLLVVIFAGCGDTSFLGRRVDNFTAFYNTFYNARKSFDKGVSGLTSTDQPISRDAFLPVYPAPERAGGRGDFDDAIRRSADILRDHPNSRWVDDAVMLIGKSYFYQQNYSAASQKFREAIELDTGLQDEARFWLARSLIANGEYDAANVHLDEVLQRERVDRRVLPQLHLIRGDLSVRLLDWASAIDALRTGLRDVRDREDESRAWYLLGQVYEHVGEYAEAHTAFDRVTRLSAPFELDYAARLNAVRLFTRLDERHAAIEGLRRLERDGKYLDRRAELAYFRARAHRDLGEITDARAVLTDLLYSGDYDVSRVRGRAHYTLAELYRYELGDYSMAAAHYDTAATALQTPQRAQQGGRPAVATQFAILDSRELADVFGTYARVYGQISRMDSLLHLASLPDDEFEAFVLERRQDLARELAERQRAQERERMEQQFVQPGVDPTVQSPNDAAAGGSVGGGSSGFLFHRDPVRVQEGRLAFARRWGDRPLVPAWRRADAVAALAQRRSAEDEPTTVVSAAELNPSVEGGLPYIDVSDVPREPFLRAQMEAEMARASYELGNVLFLSMNEPDRAVEWYRRVIEQYDEPSVRSRAYYALAELMRGEGDEEQARRLYQEVLTSSNDDELLTRVREYLGMEFTQRSDSASVAVGLYDAAFQQWQRGQFEPAFVAMVETAMQYPATEAAPRALMASSRIGLEWIRRDSLSMFEPLPSVFPDSLLIRGGLIEGRSYQPIFSVGVVGDSLLMAGTTLTVSRILSHLANEYSTHRLAAQARDILDGLHERRPPDEAPADDVEVGEALVPEEDGADEVVDEADAPPPDEVVEMHTLQRGANELGNAVGSAPNSVYGAGHLDLTSGGWSIVVAEFPARALAEQRVSDLRREGYLAGVHVVAEGALFQVLVGHFEIEEAATSALFEMSDELSEAGRVVEISPEADLP